MKGILFIACCLVSMVNLIADIGPPATIDPMVFRAQLQDVIKGLDDFKNNISKDTVAGPECVANINASLLPILISGQNAPTSGECHNTISRIYIWCIQPVYDPGGWFVGGTQNWEIGDTYGKNGGNAIYELLGHNQMWSLQIPDGEDPNP